jgi:acyl carrier protein
MVKPPPLAMTAHPRPALASTYVAPSNPVEEKVAQIWQEFLGIDRIGIHDSFFELGGHSLLATQITSRLRQEFPVEFSLSNFFGTPTIAGQALALTEEQLAEVDLGAVATLLAEIEKLSPNEVEAALSTERQLTSEVGSRA